MKQIRSEADLTKKLQADKQQLLEAMDETINQLQHLLDTARLDEEEKARVQGEIDRLLYFLAIHNYVSPQEEEKELDYAEWEALTICALAARIDCTYSDAQGIIEAQEFYMAQAWAKGLTPEQTAQLIDETSKA